MICYSMPPKKKSRAAEARARRLLLRYEREICDRLHPSSSDDDVIPPPIGINRQGNKPSPSQSETGPQTWSGIPRYAEGRLLFYGQPNPNRLTEPDSPANSSFSDDNANMVTEDQHTDDVASLDEDRLTKDDSPANSSFSDDNANIVREDQHTDEDASLDEDHLTKVDSPASSCFSHDNIVREDRHTDEVASLDEAPLSTSPIDDEGSDVHNDTDSPTDDPPVTDGGSPYSSHFSDSGDSADDVPVRENLATFVTKHTLSVLATRDLLRIFRQAGVRDLPRDRRSLLRTPRSIDDVRDACGGKFKYLGLENGIRQFLTARPAVARDRDILQITVNVDGLPLHKSTNVQFWPIVCTLDTREAFIVALYQGDKKPNDVNEFLREFLQEFELLHANGLEFNGKHFAITLKCWVCDAPARSFLKCIKGHTGYYACERCKIRGVYHNNKVTYPMVGIHERRTDEGFAAMEYHDAPDGDNHQNGLPSPLIAAGVNAVSSVVIDVMHNVYLGTWKRFLMFLFAVGSRATCRLSQRQKQQVDEKYLRIRLPREFSRQPRSIYDLDHWKATEFRSSLLYTGFIFLRGIVSQAVYDLYLKLAVAMIILHTENEVKRNRYLPFARALLIEFIRDSGHVLGQDYVVYNVHCLCHVPDDVEHFKSSVNALSAFAYENHLQSIKKLVKGPTNPIAQVFSRLTEMTRQNFYRHKKVLQTCVSTRSQDSVFLLQDTSEFVFVQR